MSRAMAATGSEALAASMITNFGTIEGGAGGMGAASKSRSQGGAGVRLADGGVLSNNHGLIVGGYGVHGSNANGVGEGAAPACSCSPAGRS